MKAIRQWLIDTYNGIYVIVLKPHMPSYVTVLGVVLALLFGLFWGYVLSPVIYYDGSPSQLSQPARDQWIQMVAAANEAGFYSQDDIRSLLNRVEDPVGNVQRLIGTTEASVQRGLQNLLPLIADAEGNPLTAADGQVLTPGNPAPQPGGISQDLLNIVLAVVVVIVLALIISPIWRLLIKGNVVMPIYDRLRPKSEEEMEERKRMAEERELIREKKKMEEEMRAASGSAAATNPYGAPMIQKLAIFTKGRGFDESFAIEDEDNTFYGETGAAMAKTDDNKDMVATEVWLFDKEDFVRTLTKIFVTQGAYNDTAVRAELDPRVENPATDIIVIQPNQVATLETDQLLVTATIVDAKQTAVGSYEGVTIKMEAWSKKGGGTGSAVAAPMPAAAAAVPVPAAVPPAAPPSIPSTYDPPMPTQGGQPPNFTPPMPTPTNAPTAAPPAMPPPPRRDDDDPFGGTGDFTPIGS